MVPSNQRPYAWEDEHVTSLLDDIHEAIADQQEDYFLGTVVLVGSGGALSIADGQQRLVTTTLIVLQLRNLFHKIGREPAARSVDQEFLRQHDIASDRELPRLHLSADDHDFYLNNILPAPFDARPAVAIQTPARASNGRLLRASQVIQKFFGDMLAASSDKSKVLVDWLNFLRTNARVVVVTVPDEVGAYRMFETLNDRGLRASQADILKNYFFSRSSNRLSEAEAKWSSISGAIDAGTEGDGSDDLVGYLTHLWITMYGPTKEKDLASDIKRLPAISSG